DRGAARQPGDEQAVWETVPGSAAGVPAGGGGTRRVVGAKLVFALFYSIRLPSRGRRQASPLHEKSKLRPALQRDRPDGAAVVDVLAGGEVLGLRAPGVEGEEEVIGARSAVDDVVAGVAVDGVVAVAAEDGVVAVAGVDVVVPIAAGDVVVAALVPVDPQGVVATAAVDEIVAALADDVVAAAFAVEVIAGVPAGDGDDVVDQADGKQPARFERLQGGHGEPPASGTAVHCARRADAGEEKTARRLGRRQTNTAPKAISAIGGGSGTAATSARGPG